MMSQRLHAELPLIWLPAGEGVTVMHPIDDATSAFLHSGADDLQRQLGMAAGTTS